MGERILNRFELQERLGSGGFGTVYRGWDERLERSVAVKAFEGSRAHDPRILREAQAAARLNHPGIVTLYELGSDSGRTYLVSELVEGETLSAQSRAGELSDRDIAEIGTELCEALRHAHRRGVVHRDIKPQNILVAERSGKAKLMDFGIARVLGGEPLTANGDVVGTIAYMAPEQADGDIAGPTSDVYSLALTLYECWTGVQPVACGTPAATARQIGRPIRSLVKERRSLPPELALTIDDCLRQDPHARPELDELEGVLSAAAPLLDEAPLPPREDRHASLAGTGLLHHPWIAPALSAVAVMTLAMFGLSLSPVAAPGWLYLLAVLTGALAAIAPRAGYLTAAAGLGGWLALGADAPGAAFIVGIMALPAPLLLPRAERLWPLPAVAPLLGFLGLAPIYAAVAGVCSTAARRVVLGALGYMWLLVAEAAWGMTLLFGVAKPAEPGWEASVSAASTGLLAPLLTRPALLGAAVWAVAALCLAPLLRGRVVTLELLGVLVWAAGLLSAQRLLSQWEDAAAPAAGGLVVGVSLLVLVALLYRAGMPERIGTGRAGGGHGVPPAEGGTG